MPFTFRPLLSFLLFLCSIPAAFAQTQEQSGYVILNQDTVRGTLIYRDRDRSPESASLRVGDKTTEYTAEQITGFGVPGQARFVSRKLKYSVNPHKTEDLTEKTEMIWEEKTVFLRPLSEGTVSVYEYTDANYKPHLVIETPEGELTDLINLKFKQGEAVATKAFYRNQLKRILQDCPDVYPKIEIADFSKRAVRAIVKDYHTCIGAALTYERKKDKAGLEITLFGGYGISSQEVGGIYEGGRFDTTGVTNVNAEVSFEHILQRNFKVWSFLTGIGYRRFEVPLPTVLGDGNAVFQYLRMNLGVKRIIVNKDIKVHVSAGVGNSFLIKKPNEEVRGHEQGWYVAAGATKNRWSLEVMRERTNGYSPFNGAGVNIRTVHFRLGYIFAKNDYAR